MKKQEEKRWRIFLSFHAGGLSSRFRAISVLAVSGLAFFLAGCPEYGSTYGVMDFTGTSTSGGASGNASILYDTGFADGFSLDDWYWKGYFDGYDTVDGTTVYYAGDTIPSVDTPPYTQGYWDGIWYAYNDGYFVDYHFAFIIGFSEGYDNAYWPDYLNFLVLDQHVELANGGWMDGYEDGFSEGRVFGANDYEQGLPFDWLDALVDYESGTDLYFSEINVGTGVYGPVTLYSYGTSPGMKSGRRPLCYSRHIRWKEFKKTVSSTDRPLERPLTAEVRDELDYTPAHSIRDKERALRLKNSWLERIATYDQEMGSSGKSIHPIRKRRIF